MTTFMFAPRQCFLPQPQQDGSSKKRPRSHHSFAAADSENENPDQYTQQCWQFSTQPQSGFGFGPSFAEPLSAPEELRRKRPYTQKNAPLHHTSHRADAALKQNMAISASEPSDIKCEHAVSDGDMQVVKQPMHPPHSLAASLQPTEGDPACLAMVPYRTPSRVAPSSSFPVQDTGHSENENLDQHTRRHWQPHQSFSSQPQNGLGLGPRKRVRPQHSVIEPLSENLQGERTPGEIRRKRPCTQQYASLHHIGHRAGAANLEMDMPTSSSEPADMGYEHAVGVSSMQVVNQPTCLPLPLAASSQPVEGDPPCLAMVRYRPPSPSRVVSSHSLPLQHMESHAQRNCNVALPPPCRPPIYILPSQEIDEQLPSNFANLHVQ
jgi:hypothetical protein